MELQILINTRHIFLEDKVPTYYHVGDITICNDHEMKKSEFHNEQFIEQVGRIMALGSLADYDFGYAFVELPDDYAQNDKKVLHKILGREARARMAALNRFFSFTWFVKDNCFTAEDVIAVIPSLDKMMLTSSTNRFVSSCNGTYFDTTLNRQEIERTAMVLNKFIEICPGGYRDDIEDELPYEKGMDAPTHTIVRHNVDYNKFNRIERAMMFLETARCRQYLPYRIALLMPIFESLFSLDTGGELSQKVSQRVAFYIAETSTIRKEIFQDIRDGYTVRSKFFHGDKLPSKFTEEKMIQLSKSLDGITRAVLLKIILEDSEIFLKQGEKQKELETFLSDLIFK